MESGVRHQPGSSLNPFSSDFCGGFIMACVLVGPSALVIRLAPPLAPLPSQEVRAWGKFQPSDHLVGYPGN